MRINRKDYNKEDLKSIDTTDPEMQRSVAMANQMFDQFYVKIEWYFCKMQSKKIHISFLTEEKEAHLEHVWSLGSFFQWEDGGYFAIVRI